jgi:PAS domain S-box-containing protein
MIADNNQTFGIPFHDALPDPAWVKAPSGPYTAVNTAFANALGRRKADIVGLIDEDLFIADTATRLRAVDRRAESQVVPVAAEELVLGHDGIPRWLEIRVVAIRDAAGAVVGTCGIARDVSERKSADIATRAETVQLRAVFDESPLGLSVADPDGFIIAANPAYQQLVGYTADELKHLRFSELSTTVEAEESLVLFRDLIEGRRRSYAVEKTYRRKTGEPVRVRVRSAASRDEAGALVHLITVAEDVTDTG